MNLDLSNLGKTASVLFLALAMAGCGGGSDEAAVTDPPPPPPPQPEDVMMDLELSAAAMAALLDVLPNAGTSDEVMIEAGGMAERNGVTFTCDSAYPCMVTITNNLGTILASWSSQALPDGMAAVMAGDPPPPAPQPQYVMMDLTLSEGAREAFMDELPMAGDTDTVEIEAGGMAERNGVTFTCNSAYPCTVTVSNSLGTIIASWTSKALPNAVADVSLVVADPPRDPMIVGGANRANPATLKRAIDDAAITQIYVHFDGTMPTAIGDASQSATNVDPVRVTRPGSTAMFELQGDFVEIVAMPDDEPKITSSETASEGPVLEVGSDGLVLAGTTHTRVRVHSLERDWAHRLPDEPEDAPLYGGFVTNAIITEDIGGHKTRAFEDLFMLNADDELENVSGNPELNDMNAVFVYDGQADTNRNQKAQNEDFRGTFAGVGGIYRCGTGSCWLVKDEDGTVSVQGGTTEPDGTFVALDFIPDDTEAMASVRDWAWQIFGAWLTTPQAMSGRHSFGMIAESGGLAMTPPTAYFDALDGEAEYKGLALGYYVDGVTATTTGVAGTFTATAALTATFDSTGGDDLEGTISNFHDANGMAMNEFVVDLDGAAGNLNNMGEATGTTGGHARGVTWTGNWDATVNGVPDDFVEDLDMATTAGVLEANFGTPMDSDYPLGAVGSFDATNGSSAVSGTFGTHLQTDD